MAQPQPAQPQPTLPGQALSDSEVEMTFKEYHALMEGTDRITDRREAVNTLFVSINALFLTGVGYLLLQFLKAGTNLIDALFFTAGFFAIALIMSRVNGRWHNISEQYRSLVDLRIRYMMQLEAGLRTKANGLYSPVTIKLRAGEKRKDGATAVSGRGTYTIEDEVQYGPQVVNTPPSVSKAEQQIGRAFTIAYWTAFGFSLVILAVYAVLPLLAPNGIKLLP